MTTREATWYIISAVSVCTSDDNFRKPWRTRFIFAHPVYLLGIQVKFVYEWRLLGQGQGHRSKNGKKNPNSHDVKLPLVITLVLQKRAMFCIIIGFSAIAHWMVWPPSLSC